MRYELRSIGVWAFIKVSFLFNLVVGFILGLLYVPFLALIASMGEMYPLFGVEPVTFEISGVWTILLPLLFAILGAFFNTAAGLVLVFVYNAIAALLGGLEVRLIPTETSDRTQVSPKPPVVRPVGPMPPVEAPRPADAQPAPPPPRPDRPIGTPPPPPPVGPRPTPPLMGGDETGGKDET